MPDESGKLLSWGSAIFSCLTYPHHLIGPLVQGKLRGHFRPCRYTPLSLPFLFAHGSNNLYSMVGLPGIYSLPRVMRIITATTAGRTLLISLVLYGLVFQYCRWRFWRDPHSAFFDDKHVYDLQYSLYREHEAAQYLSAYNAESEPPPAPHAVADPVMCVAVATVKRDQVNYFEAAVGSLLQGLDPRERAALSVNVVFVDTDPSKHPSWGQRWMDRLVDSVGTYNVTREDMERLRSWEESHNYYEKGVL